MQFSLTKLSMPRSGYFFYRILPQVQYKETCGQMVKGREKHKCFSAELWHFYSNMLDHIKAFSEQLRLMAWILKHILYIF